MNPYDLRREKNGSGLYELLRKWENVSGEDGGMWNEWTALILESGVPWERVATKINVTERWLMTQTKCEIR
jgi:hypothetical protein